jgi:CubicO group peptidase (beta-lactamase class C family)
VGLRADLRPRKVVPDFRNNYPIGHKSRNTPGPNGAFEDEQGEMPWVGIVSTTPDLFRFADMFRSGGTANGARLLSPAMIEMASRNWTGEMVNELYAARGREEGLDPAPAYIGLGFSVRGTALCPHMFGTLASPRSFGNYGAGTSLFWIDPERDITFACLTAGVMGHNANMRRFQKIGDMVLSAAD